jgi:hypothetical protein
MHRGQLIPPIRERDARLLEPECPDVAPGERDPGWQPTDPGRPQRGSAFVELEDASVEQIGDPEAAAVGLQRRGDPVDPDASLDPRTVLRNKRHTREGQGHTDPPSAHGESCRRARKRDRRKELDRPHLGALWRRRAHPVVCPGCAERGDGSEATERCDRDEGKRRGVHASSFRWRAPAPPGPRHSLPRITPPDRGYAAGYSRRTRLHWGEPRTGATTGKVASIALAGAWTTCSHPCPILPPLYSRDLSSRRTALVGPAPPRR